MSIFTRKHKQPQPIVTNLYNSDTVAIPVPPTETVLPAIATVKPVMPEVVFQCAACGHVGATQQLIVSYFGYLSLPYVYLCQECEDARVAAHREHNLQLKRRFIAGKETIEMVAV